MTLKQRVQMLEEDMREMEERFASLTMAHWVMEQTVAGRKRVDVHPAMSEREIRQMLEGLRDDQFVVFGPGNYRFDRPLPAMANVYFNGSEVVIKPPEVKRREAQRAAPARGLWGMLAK